MNKRICASATLSNREINHSNIEKPKIWALFFGKSFVLLYVLGFVLICFAVSFFPLMAYRHLIRRIYFLLLRVFFVIHAHRARPRLPSCKRLRSKECPRRRIKWRYATAGQQETAKRVMSNVQTKMAFRHHRATRDREAQSFQCAEQNGVPPPPGNKRLRSTEFPMCKTKWRSATTEQQQSAKQTMFSV